MSAIVNEWGDNQTYGEALRNAIWSMPVGHARGALQEERQFLLDVDLANFSLTHPGVAPYLTPQIRSLLQKVAAGNVQAELALIDNYMARLAPFDFNAQVSSIWDAAPPPPPPSRPAPVPDAEDYYSDTRLYLNDAGDLEYADGTLYQPDSGRVPLDDGWVDTALGLATDLMANALWDRLNLDLLGDLLAVTDEFQNVATVANALENTHQSARDALGMLMDGGTSLPGAEIGDRLDATLWDAQREAHAAARTILEGNNIPPAAYSNLNLANDAFTAPIQIETDDGTYEVPYTGPSMWDFLLEAYIGGVHFGFFPDFLDRANRDETRLLNWQTGPDSAAEVSFAYIPSTLGGFFEPHFMGFEPSSVAFAIGSIFDDRVNLYGLGRVFAATGDGDDTVVGGASDDRLFGGSGDDELWGDGGADALYGGDGKDSLQGGTTEHDEEGNPTDFGTDHDTIFGGADDDLITGLGGNDSLSGDGGSDTVFGGTSNDTLHGGAQNDWLHGDEGNDSLTGDGGFDRLYGGDGNDTLNGGTASDTLYGGAGNDLLDGGASADLIAAGIGNDTVHGGTSNDTTYGGSGSDWLHGDQGDDYLFGGTGLDRIFGGDGNDTLDGGTASDTLYGGAGEDSIFGGSSADLVAAGLGNDTVHGGTSNDTAYGGAGSDWLYGEQGDDSLSGGTGFDRLSGGDGNDTLDGGTASDTLYGGAGADRVFGGSSADLIAGGSGHDTLSGGTSNDTIFGGGDNDVIHGGQGSDLLTGGTGLDVFVFNTAIGSDIDTITDFNPADDTIHLSSSVFAGMAPGALGAGVFAANLSGLATSAAMRIVYESDTGALFFDSDGSGPGARVQFATLETGLALTGADFLVV